MHDQIRVALDLHRPAAVIVDAVAVERERREAEEQHGVGRDAAAPRDVRGRFFTAGSLIALAGLISSRNTVRRSSSTASPRGPKMRLTVVANTRVPVPPDLAEMSASSVSRRSVSPIRMGWWKRKRSPANMRRGRGMGGTTPVSPGLPSSTELARAEARQPVEDVPARRQRIALDELALGPPEGQPQEVGGRGGDDVAWTPGAARYASSAHRVQRGVRHAEDTSTPGARRRGSG